MENTTQYSVSSFSYPSNEKFILNELKIILLREGSETKQSRKIWDLIKDYVKNHSSGNPAFTLDNWQDNNNFIAIPSLLSDREKWVDYLKKCNDKELTQISIQSGFIREYIEHKRKQEFLKK